MTFQEQRMQICNNCEYKLDELCILCGCDLVSKTADPDQSCPKHPKNWDVYIKEEPPVVATGGLVRSTKPACRTCTKRGR